VPADEARYAAPRAFGNPTLIREQTLSVLSWSWLENLLRDFRIGIRTLFRSPASSQHGVCQESTPCRPCEPSRQLFNYTSVP